MTGEAGFAILAILFTIVWGALAFLAGSIYGWKRGQKEVLRFMNDRPPQRDSAVPILGDDDNVAH